MFLIIRLLLLIIQVLFSLGFRLILLLLVYSWFILFPPILHYTFSLFLVKSCRQSRWLRLILTTSWQILIFVLKPLFPSLFLMLPLSWHHLLAGWAVYIFRRIWATLLFRSCLISFNSKECWNACSSLILGKINITVFIILNILLSFSMLSADSCIS